MPDYSKSIKKVKAENPDVAGASISEAGPIASFLSSFGGKARATTNPFTGNVSYYPGQMAGMGPDEVDNLFTHELQHSRQIQGMSPMRRLMAVGRSMLGEEPYAERPRELEAFQAERDRTARLGLNVPSPYTQQKDIQLPPMSKRRQTMSMFTNDRPMR